MPLPARSEGPLRVGLNPGDCSGHSGGGPKMCRTRSSPLRNGCNRPVMGSTLFPSGRRMCNLALTWPARPGLDESAVSPVCYTHEAFLNRIEKLDLIVCLKLHAGILAAAANVPFVSLEYQPKCRDFAASLGWEDFVLRTDQIQPRRLIGLVEMLIAQLDSKRVELCRSMCGLMNSFEQYCNQIEPMLLSSSG